MSDVSEYLKEVREDMEAYKKLKAESPGSLKGWRRDGYTLMADKKGGSVEITYFGAQGVQGRTEDTALDFCVAAHNLPLEEHLATLLRMVEGLDEKKLRSAMPTNRREPVGAK